MIKAWIKIKKTNKQNLNPVKTEVDHNSVFM